MAEIPDLYAATSRKEVRRNGRNAFNLARRHFGGALGEQLAQSFTRLVGGQAHSYDWMRNGLTSGRIDRYDMVLDAVAELVLLSEAEPDVDPRSLVVPAWKAVTSAAWTAVGRYSKEFGLADRVTVTADLAEMLSIWLDIPPTNSADGGLPTLDLSALSEKQAAVVAARSEGFTWREVSELVGYSVKSPGAAHAFWRGVARLIEGNPSLVVRFGLVRCPQYGPPSGRHLAGCRCHGAKWIFEDGSSI